MTERSSFLPVFQRFLPEGAAKYCFGLWMELGFEFKITKARKTKLGDFRFDPRTNKSTITVNHNLNPYAFLVTYLHEVAHHITHQEYGRKVMPHGKEWKDNFKKVSLPVLTPEVLPDEVLRALAGYLKNPAATSCTDPNLTRVLNGYSSQDNETLLMDLPIGSYFQFKNKIYKSLEKKRTRLVCQEHKSGRRYLINGAAQVMKVETRPKG
ncbi:MAG: SprT-like domain-containing protein [bacterium]|nr:SprT-like domain-containing protein [bacterium]